MPRMSDASRGDRPGLSVGDIEIPDALPEPDGARILVVCARELVRHDAVRRLTRDGEPTWAVDAAADSSSARVRIAAEEWAALVIDTGLVEHDAVVRTARTTPRHRRLAIVDFDGDRDLAGLPDRVRTALAGDGDPNPGGFESGPAG